MIRQCAWCSDLLGQIEPLDDPTVTHGLCTSCQQILYEVYRETDERGPADPQTPADTAPYRTMTTKSAGGSANSLPGSPPGATCTVAALPPVR